MVGSRPSIFWKVGGTCGLMQSTSKGGMGRMSDMSFIYLFLAFFSIASSFFWAQPAVSKAYLQIPIFTLEPHPTQSSSIIAISFGPAQLTIQSSNSGAHVFFEVDDASGPHLADRWALAGFYSMKRSCAKQLLRINFFVPLDRHFIHFHEHVWEPSSRRILRQFSSLWRKTHVWCSAQSKKRQDHLRLI